MGDCLQADKPPQYFTMPPRPTQPPTLSRMGNEYQPSALMLCGWGLKAGMAHFICGSTCGHWQVKLCDPSLTRAIPERHGDEQLNIKHYKNKASFTLYFLLLSVSFNSVLFQS